MKCPGQDTRYWKPGDIFDIPCPHCGSVVEFFKDDSSRSCRHCGRRIPNPKCDFGCAAYCRYADRCLQELPPDVLSGRPDLLRKRAASEMKRVFGADIRRAEHALRVADYAERIAQQEQADMGVVLIAAYLHDIGIPEAERRYDNPDEQCHERLGAPAARTLLENIGAEAPLIDEVCDIIGRHHRPGPEETINYKAVYDADLLVNRMQKYADSSQCRDTATDVCANGFLTEAGKRLAAEVILQNSGKREV